MCLSLNELKTAHLAGKWYDGPEDEDAENGRGPMTGTQRLQNSNTPPKAGTTPQSPSSWTHNVSLVGKATLLQGSHSCVPDSKVSLIIHAAGDGKHLI